MSLFRKKSLEQLMCEATANHGLKRTLTWWHLILLGVGGIIGTGIFVLTGTVASQHTGPALVLSILFSSLACLLAGLCYAEYASMIPISGSAYTYAYATSGELIAWIIGWDLILEYLFNASTVAVGWSGYAIKFLEVFGVSFPKVLTASPWIFDHGQWSVSGSWCNLPAMLLILGISAILYIGIQESIRVNNVIVVIKVIVLLLFVGFGSSYVLQSNWHPFIPANTGKFGEFGLSGLLSGAGIIFFAYIGFDAACTTAQETINPQKNIPIGILGGLIICTILYVGVALVLTGIVSYTELNVPAPVHLAIEHIGAPLRWLLPLVDVGAIAGLTSVVLVLLLAQTRIFYIMSNDGLLPPLFAKVHSRFKTPHVATVMTAVVASVTAGLLPLTVLAELVSIGTLLAFTMVCISVIIMRKTHPHVHRPFRTPWVPGLPIFGAVVCIAQMIGLSFDTWIRLAVWMLLGLVIYFQYGRHRSRLLEIANTAVFAAENAALHPNPKSEFKK